MVLGLKVALVPARKCPFEARIALLLSLCKETRTVIPLFLLVFTGYGYKKNIFKGEKNLVGRSCIFFIRMT